MTRYALSSQTRELFSSRTLRRMLLLYVCISLVLFVTILSVLSVRMVRKERETRIVEARVNLDRAEHVNENYIRSILNYGVLALDDYGVRGLLYSNEFTPYLSINSRSIYTQVANISNLVTGVQFVNFNTRTVLDANGRYAFQNYGDQELLAWLEARKPSNFSPTYFYPRRMNQAAMSAPPNRKMVLSAVYYYNSSGALVLNLGYDAYKKQVLPVNVGRHTEYFIVNAENLLFCATDDSLVMRDSTQDEAFRQIEAQEADQGAVAMKGQTVIYRKNAPLGLTYYAVVTHGSLGSDALSLRRILSLGVLFLLASLVVSYALALITSLPFRKLHSRIRQSVPEALPVTAANQDEIAYLNEVYQQAFTANQRLAEQSKTHQHEKENWQLLHLMNQDTDPRHAASVTEVDELAAQFVEPDFLVIAISINGSAASAATGGHELRLQMAGVAAAMLDDLGTVRMVFPLSLQILVVFNTDMSRREAIRERLEALLRRCRESLNDEQQYVGVGGTVAALSDIADSYEGAMEAVQHARVTQMNQVCWRDELCLRPLSEQHYPHDIDAELMKAIKHQQTEQAEQSVEAFFRHIATYHYSHYLRNLLQLDAAFQRLENSLQFTLDNSTDTNTLTQWNMEEARQFFTQRARLDISQQGSTRKDRSDNRALIEQINRMIEERIYDASLSVTQLADELSFSVNYLRSLYKATTGETLSSYITARRIEAACKLLDETSDPIDQITERLGFSSRNYFFTFFKNHMGMTPTQYRNRNRE